MSQSSPFPRAPSSTAARARWLSSIKGDGRFEPRDVKLSRKGDGYVEVTSGLHDGESIVVNGNFLIDAESNLQAALKALAAPPDKEQHQ